MENVRPIPAQEQTASRVYQKASPAVVTVKNGSGHGSGFLVSPDGIIITNAHVVADGPRVVTVKFSNGQQASADVIGFAKNGDGGDAHCAASANDATSNFAAIGNEQFGDGWHERPHFTKRFGEGQVTDLPLR